MFRMMTDRLNSLISGLCIFAFWILISFFLLGQTEHQIQTPPPPEQIIESQAEGIEIDHQHDHAAHGEKQEIVYKKFIRWIGNFHPISIHFPIALIVMTGLAELLYLKFPYPIYSNASRFMIIAAAVTAIPTALLGLAYGYEANYSGVLSELFWWHRFCGISTAFLAALTAILKELLLRKKINDVIYYYTALVITIAFVTTTGYLGGEMTFGLFNLFP
ncbi:MAG: hypothetical protein K940chlam3_01680 [Chlamydiae bacterium]|nr:hypothetical protein [Chlamydiota bacterium]